MASPFSWPVLVPYALRAPAPVNLGVSHLQQLCALSATEHLTCLPLAESIKELS
jgi:hypothetical protein